MKLACQQAVDQLLGSQGSSRVLVRAWLYDEEWLCRPSTRRVSSAVRRLSPLCRQARLGKRTDRRFRDCSSSSGSGSEWWEWSYLDVRLISCPAQPHVGLSHIMSF